MSGEPAKVPSNNRGTPKFDIPYEVLANLIYEGLKVKDTGNLLSVAEKIIYQQMQDFSLKKRCFNKTCFFAKRVVALCSDFPFSGGRILNKTLKKEGVYVPQFRLKECVLCVEVAGVKSRKRNRLHRRSYTI